MVYYEACRARGVSARPAPAAAGPSGAAEQAVRAAAARSQGARLSTKPLVLTLAAATTAHAAQ
jgi:hypothetical protein